MSTDTLTLPSIHLRDCMLSPKRCSVMAIKAVAEPKKFGSDSKFLDRLRRSSKKKLHYIFEADHQNEEVSEAQLIKERQAVFLRVQKIIRKKMTGTAKFRGFQSPTRLRRVLLAPEILTNR
jgi:hypothetical protein